MDQVGHQLQRWVATVVAVVVGVGIAVGATATMAVQLPVPAQMLPPLLSLLAASLQLQH